MPLGEAVALGPDGASEEQVRRAGGRSELAWSRRVAPSRPAQESILAQASVPRAWPGRAAIDATPSSPPCGS